MHTSHPAGRSAPVLLLARAALSLSITTLTGCSSDGTQLPSAAATPWVGTYECTETVTTSFPDWVTGQPTTSTTVFRDPVEVTARGDVLTGVAQATIGDSEDAIPVCTVVAIVDAGPTATVTSSASAYAGAACTLTVPTASFFGPCTATVTGGAFLDDGGAPQGTVDFTCADGPDAGVSATGTMTIGCSRDSDGGR
jgi:hypothetical protein